jgi:hypothetical protein
MDMEHQETELQLHKPIFQLQLVEEEQVLLDLHNQVLLLLAEVVQIQLFQQLHLQLVVAVVKGDLVPQHQVFLEVLLVDQVVVVHIQDALALVYLVVRVILHQQLLHKEVMEVMDLDPEVVDQVVEVVELLQ